LRNSCELQVFYITGESPFKQSGGGFGVKGNYRFLKKSFPDLIYIGPGKPRDCDGLSVPDGSNFGTKLKQALRATMTPIGAHFPLIRAYIVRKAHESAAVHRLFFVENTRLGFAGYFIRQHFGQESLIIYNAHNVEIDYMRTNTRNPVRHFVTYVNERTAHHTGDSILVLTDEDIIRFRELYRMGRARLYSAPHCIDNLPPGAKNRHLQIPPLQALFVGSLNVQQNVKAITFLLKDVLPKIRAKCQGKVKLAIAGSSPSRHVYKMATKSSVKLIASPSTEALRDLYAGSHVFLSPVKGGSGFKVKNLDALRHGLPVIASRDSLRGYKRTASYAISAEKANDYVNALTYLLDCPQNLAAMSHAAIKYVARYHSPDVRNKRLAYILERGMEDRGWRCR
jgi:glycosyltransferase involved in cell wall biosynthesis